MSNTHITDLRLKLEANKWDILEEAGGNDYDISAVWKVARRDGVDVRHVAFEGSDELRCLPLEESYGCSVVEAPDISLYFSRKNRSWKDELSQFIEKFNQL